MPPSQRRFFPANSEMVPLRMGLLIQRLRTKWGWDNIFKHWERRFLARLEMDVSIVGTEKSLKPYAVREFFRNSKEATQVENFVRKCEDSPVKDSASVAVIYEAWKDGTYLWTVSDDALMTLSRAILVTRAHSGVVRPQDLGIFLHQVPLSEWMQLLLHLPFTDD